MKKIFLTLFIIAGLFISANAQRMRQTRSIRPIPKTERRHIRVKVRRHKIERKLRHHRHRTALLFNNNRQYMMYKQQRLAA
jgi:hypothetical protein